MYVLKREEAIRAVSESIQKQDNDILQSMYQDESVLKVIDQADIFKLWHGFLPLDSLSDECIRVLMEFFRIDFLKYHEYKDYSHVVDEFVEGIENKNTRYLTKNSISHWVELADRIYKKDLPELSRDEIMSLIDMMMETSSPTTIRNAINKASSFCDWCIKNEKYPNAQNNFKSITGLSYEPWVEKNLVKDDADLVYRLNRAGFVFDEGNPAFPLLALAWMGFDRRKVLEIKNEDVDLIQHLVCDQKIPEAFLEIFQKYDGGSKFLPCGRTMIELRQEDLGFFIKRLVKVASGIRFDDTAIINTLYDTKFSYDNIWLSGMMYRLYEYERQELKPINNEIFQNIFQVKSSAALTRYKRIYQAYKSIYWGNA
ncbi:MAG: hypothetical protein ACI4TK_19395 [Agathobacter sp.]